MTSSRRSRLLLALFLATPAAYLACSGGDPEGAGTPPETTSPDASTSTADTGTPPVEDASVADVTDAGADAVTDANASDASDASADAGPELLSPANCPRAIALKGSKIYWSESYQPGLCPGQTMTPGIRATSKSGSATLPAQIYVGGQSTSAPTGIAVVGASDTLYFADNQGPHNNLWRLEADGGATLWGPNAGPIGPTALAGGDDYLFWNSQSGTHRSATAAAGGDVQIDTGLASASGGSVHAIALDNDNTYAIRGSAPNEGVYSCGRDKLCTGGTAPLTIALEPNLRGVATDGVDVFFTGGDPSFIASTTEKVFKCPKSGCLNGVPALFASTVTTVNGNGYHDAVAVDATNVYWSTIEGKIYACSKLGAACAAPKTLASGVRPVAFAQDATYLYWADRRGGIYRIAK